VGGTNYGYTQYNGQLVTNHIIMTVNPGSSFSVTSQNSSTGVVLQPTSTIIITSLSSGPIGPTGMTGFTGFGVRNTILQPVITFGSTITAPTFTGITVQQSMYRLIGDKWRVTYKFGWGGGSNAGDGDYLISLTTGLSFNLSGQANQTYTGVIFPSDYSTIARAIVPTLGGIIETTNWGTSSYIIPYDATRFRLVLPFNGTLQTWSSTSYGVRNGLLSIEFEIWSIY
jgi:hypothetical protein